MKGSCSMINLFVHTPVDARFTGVDRTSGGTESWGLDGVEIVFSDFEAKNWNDLTKSHSQSRARESFRVRRIEDDRELATADELKRGIHRARIHLIAAGSIAITLSAFAGTTANQSAASSIVVRAL